MKNVRWLIAVLAASLPSVIQAATATSVSQWGITWTFDKAYEVGQFVNGDWWVQGPVTINSVTPAWDGTRNGTMVDPVPSTQQGYRQGLDLTFNDALRAVFPLTLSGRRSVVSTIGLAQVNTGGSHEGLQTAAILTVVDTLVPATAFRPAYINCAKKIYTTGQIRYDLLPTVALPASATIPSTTYMQRVWLDHAAIRGNAGATIHPTDNMEPYYFGVPAATQALLCFLDVPERNTYLVRFLQWGLDLYPMSLVNSDVWIAYGGFGRSRKWPILFAGLMFDDENMKHPPDTTFFNNNPAAPVSKFSEDGHTFYGQPTVEYPNGKPLWGQDCIAIGAPHYATYCAGDTENVNASGNKDCRDPAGVHDNCSGYLEINSDTYAGEALASHFMAARAVWGWDAFFDYTDRYVTRTDLTVDYLYGNLFIYRMWTAYRNVDLYPPHNPSGLNSAAITDHEITLTWIAPTQAEDGDYAAYYVIKRDNVQAGTSFATTFIDKYLTAATQYAYAVYAADTAGNLSRGATTASLTTATDNSGPLLDTVFTADQTTVVVVFNEAVGQSSAENIGNYAIPGVSVVSAVRDQNQYRVMVTTTAHTAGNSYTLTATGIQDLGGRASGSLQKTYTARDGFFDDFESGTTAKWTPSVSANWEVLDDAGDKSLHCKTITAERLLAPVNFSTFTLTCDLKGEGTSVYRNNCVVFGYQDTSNYYYVQFAGSSSTTYNGIFKVENNVTTKVAGTGSAALLTETANYHAVKLTVDRNTGRINVWFDGNLAFTLLDNTYRGGRVGVWCKTKTGFFDNVRVQQYIAATVGIAVVPPAISHPDQTRTFTMTSNPSIGTSLFFFSAASARADRRLEIYTPSGVCVRQLTVPAGQTAMVWDGRDMQGQRVEPGVYLVKCGKSFQKSVLLQ